MKSLRRRSARPFRHAAFSEPLEERRLLSAMTEDCGCGAGGGDAQDGQAAEAALMAAAAAPAVAADASSSGGGASAGVADVGVAAASPDSDNTDPAGWSIYTSQDLPSLIARTN